MLITLFKRHYAQPIGAAIFNGFVLTFFIVLERCVAANINILFSYRFGRDPLRVYLCCKRMAVNAACASKPSTMADHCRSALFRAARDSDPRAPCAFVNARPRMEPVNLDVGSKQRNSIGTVEESCRDQHSDCCRGWSPYNFKKL